MKNKIFIISIMTLMSFAFAKAQGGTRGIRVAFIDMEYILENVPEYQKANQQLEQKMGKWKQEIDAMNLEVQQMKDALQNERVLLTNELIEEKEEDIKIKEEELLEYQQKRFGVGGDFELQKIQLIQPVQDQVFNEVRKIGGMKKYDYILDSSEAAMLYNAERHDLSDQVLKAIGRTAKIDSRNKGKGKKPTKEEIKEQEKEDRYLSVQEAEKVEEKEEAREQLLNDREKARLEKLRVRDSIKAARAAAFKKRRDSILDARKRRRDSILKVREEKRKANQKKS
ncbi:OmpH family outer membrane protein [Nonlabens sp.]|uniref:OmpH family outer membrane protein n=1 Tax=Nonlabens sp. TaxID=1888209 RepID=UPI003F6A14B6